MRKFFFFLLLTTLPLYASSGDPQDGSALTFILKLINLLLFFGLLYFLLARPVRQVFISKQQNVSEELANSDERIRRSEELIEQIDERIEQYRRDEEHTNLRYEREVEQMKAENTEAIRKDIQNVRDTAERLITQEVEQARSLLKMETLKLSVEMAEQYLSDAVTEEDRKKFVSRMLEELKS